MTKRRFIEQGWLAYAEQVIPAGASEVQQVECKRAYYAGAAALFVGILTALDAGSEPTENDLARMDDLRAELDEWLADPEKR